MFFRKKLKKGFEKEAVNRAFLTFVLWLISKGETHGYDIIKRINNDKGMPKITASRIYPILQELTKQGCVSQKKEKHGKRIKKLYKITEKGRKMIGKAKEHVNCSPLRRQYMFELLGVK